MLVQIRAEMYITRWSAVSFLRFSRERLAPSARLRRCSRRQTGQCVGMSSEVYKSSAPLLATSDDSSTIINAYDENLSSEMSTMTVRLSALTSLVRLSTLLRLKGRAVQKLRRLRLEELCSSYIHTQCSMQQIIHPSVLLYKLHRV